VESSLPVSGPGLDYEGRSAPERSSVDLAGAVTDQPYSRLLASSSLRLLERQRPAAELLVPGVLAGRSSSPV